MKIRIALTALTLLLLTSCGQKNNTSQSSNATTTTPVTYAKGFDIKHFDGYTQVDVRNPWDTTKTLHRYLLIPSQDTLPETLPSGTVIRTPIERVIAYSSVHCGILEALGIRNELVGVCESRYIDLDFVKEGLRSGRIFDLGEAASPDIEKVIASQAQGIITSPIENMSYGRIEKVGVPMIECIDYMEVTPLGRAEWMRFYALFFNKESLADSLFQQTVTAYTTTKALAQNVTKRPTVLTETKTGAVWYLPGGASYMANLFADAGADYPWSENSSSGSVPTSFESVLERGANADIWLMKYNAPQDLTYSALKNEFPGYQHFAPFKNKAIFACNTGKTTYYEELPMHPDYLLKDFVWIFHPELLPDYKPRYFKKLAE